MIIFCSFCKSCLTVDNYNHGEIGIYRDAIITKIARSKDNSSWKYLVEYEDNNSKAEPRWVKEAAIKKNDEGKKHLIDVMPSTINNF